MHMSVSCPCVCRKRVGLCAAVLHCPCPAGRRWDHLWSALWGQEAPTHQHTYWPENNIINTHIFISWYLLIIPSFFCSFSLAYVFISLFCCFLFVLLTSPSYPPPPNHSAPDWLHLPPQGGPTAAVTGHCSCRTGGPQASIPHHCKVCGCCQPCWALTNTPCCWNVHQ